MNQAMFNEVVAEQFKACGDLLIHKGADYSDGGGRLSNFKVNAARLDMTPVQVWAIYFIKHINAIETFVKKGKLSSEPIESRIDEAINYLILLRALVKEGQHSDKDNKGIAAL